MCKYQNPSWPINIKFRLVPKNNKQKRILWSAKKQTYAKAFYSTKFIMERFPLAKGEPPWNIHYLKKLILRNVPHRIVGQKHPLKIDKIWAIWVRLELQKKLRDLALINMGY